MPSEKTSGRSEQIQFSCLRKWNKDMEKKKTKKTNKNREVLRRILLFTRPYAPFIVISFVCAAVSVAVSLIVPVFCGKAIDEMIGAGSVRFEGVMTIIGGIGIVVAVAALAQWIMAVCNNKITFGVSRDLRNEAIRKIQTLPLSFLDSHPTGDLLSRITADVDTFSDGLLMGFTQLFSGVITILGTVGFMLYVSPLITLVVVVLTPMSLLVARYIASHTYRYFRQQTVARGDQTAFINEMIEGMKVVQSFGYEEESQEKFDGLNRKLTEASRQATFYSSLTNPVTRFVNSMTYAAVALAGALYAISGGISIGQLSVFLSYANQYAKPFNDISSVITELENAIACADRLFRLLDEEEQPKEKETILQTDGHVEISGVDFSYVPEIPLIENFNLDVSPGRRVAIVGPTGCGKTTLINLLMRFYDVKNGSIRVAGTDIRDVTRHSLRGSYGMVLQDIWLKAGTIRENICYGKPDATDEEVIAAAKAAHAHSFIRRLPNGYDTVITEDGGNISQGQKQLLCITRVMLHLPPMLILDEATSSIDTRTEIKIQAAFARMMKGRTSFIVAHRLSTIREADVILVMDSGHIVEQGNHDSLMEKNGAYARLYMSQFSAEQ